MKVKKALLEETDAVKQLDAERRASKDIPLAPYKIPLRLSVSPSPHSPNLGFVHGDSAIMETDKAPRLNPVDRLARCTGLSLFPTVFGLSFDYSEATEPENELDDIHKRLKAEALKSPKKLLERAVSIREDGSELLNAKMMSYLPHENKNEEAGVAAMEQARERRPALSRKRARFCLRPDSGLTVVNLQPTLDSIFQINHPDEFFLAFKRLEDAKREIRRQTGCGSTDLNQVPSSPIIRPRRPEIPRKSVKHKYQFSSLVFKNEENAVSNEKDVRLDDINLTNLILEQAPDQIISVPERENLDSPTSIINNKLDKILDELLSGNFEDLEGNEAIRHLEERLQIKPIELETLSLPELEGFENIKVEAPRLNFSKPRNALSDIHNLVKGRSSQKEKHRLFSNLASSTPSKSPYASLTSLKKCIQLPNPLNDQFSAHEIDELPARNLSLFEATNELSCPFNIGKQSNASHEKLSTSRVEDAVRSNKNDSNEVIEHLSDYFELYGSENSLKDDGNANFYSSQFDVDGDTSGSLQKRAISEKSHSFKVKADDIKGKQKEVVQSELNGTLVHSTIEQLSIIQQQLGESSTATVMDACAMNACENVLGQNDEQREMQESGVPQNDEQKETQECGVALKKKGKRQKVNNDKNRRQSLAAAGTAWESGLRRSTRIKVPPLKFWKGERFLYGRVHQSLATVIGLKYVSPTKGGGEPTMRVKSYVGDEHKDLVERAAL